MAKIELCPSVKNFPPSVQFPKQTVRCIRNKGHIGHHLGSQETHSGKSSPVTWNS